MTEKSIQTSSKLRVLVCGGRNYDDKDKVFSVLDELACKDENNLLGRVCLTIIHGGAQGADLLADQWAITNWHHIFMVKADWTDLSHKDAIIRKRKDGTLYDAKAGIRRNQILIDEGQPDLVIAFPGGRGTADMVRRARKAGIPIREIV